MSNSLLSRLKQLFGTKPAPQTAATSAQGTTTEPARQSSAGNAVTQIPEQPHALTIWMIERDRYGVRGRALSTEIEVYESEAVRLCDGVSGYVLHTPNGETVVVEARSGGLIGSSLEALLDDVRDMAATDLIRQIDTNRKEFNRMKHELLNNDEFWAALSLNDRDPEVGQDY